MLRPPPSSTLFPYTTLFRSFPSCRKASFKHSQRRVIFRSRLYQLLSSVPRIFRPRLPRDRKSTRLNSSHRCISYAVFCLKKKNEIDLVNCVVYPVLSIAVEL